MPSGHEDKLLSPVRSEKAPGLPAGVKRPLDYPQTGSGRWGQLPVGV